MFGPETFNVQLEQWFPKSFETARPFMADSSGPQRGPSSYPQENAGRVPGIRRCSPRTMSRASAPLPSRFTGRLIVVTCRPDHPRRRSSPNRRFRGSRASTRTWIGRGFCFFAPLPIGKTPDRGAALPGAVGETPIIGDDGELSGFGAAGQHADDDVVRRPRVRIHDGDLAEVFPQPARRRAAVRQRPRSPTGSRGG